MTEENAQRNIYNIGDVIAAVAFASILLFLAYLLGYGMGISRGEDKGAADTLKHQLEAK